MMAEQSQNWEIVTAFDADLEAKAAEVVANAWARIEPGYPGNPKVHAKRLSRAMRLGRLGNHGVLVGIVAQWLSAKARSSAASGAKAAADRVAQLADEIALLERHLAEAAAALRYEQLTDDGVEVADQAYLAAAALREALPSISFAQEAARAIQAHLPAGARGRSGVVGALREAPPDDALAFDLASLWTACGLSTEGGEDGDGLDRFLSGVLDEHAARKSLVNARARMSTKSSIL